MKRGNRRLENCMYRISMPDPDRALCVKYRDKRDAVIVGYCYNCLRYRIHHAIPNKAERR